MEDFFEAKETEGAEGAEEAEGAEKVEESDSADDNFELETGTLDSSEDAKSEEALEVRLSDETAETGEDVSETEDDVSETEEVVSEVAALLDEDSTWEVAASEISPETPELAGAEETAVSEATEED